MKAASVVILALLAACGSGRPADRNPRAERTSEAHAADSP